MRHTLPYLPASIATCSSKASCRFTTDERRAEPHSEARVLPNCVLTTHGVIFVNRPLTVVHARRFEGQCVDRLKTGMLMCRNPAAMQGERVPELMGACNLTTDYINVEKAVLVSDHRFWVRPILGRAVSSMFKFD